MKTVTAWTLALLWSATPALAQSNSGGDTASATDAIKAAASEQPQKSSVIYVPFRALRTVFEQPGATVFLPLAEYMKLWEQKLGTGLRLPDQPPVGGVIGSAHYVATVEQDVARIVATLKVQVLKEGWVEIPVAFGTAAIGNVTSEPHPVLLRGTGQGTYALLCQHVGEHTVTFELSARVTTAPDGRSFALQVPPVGITRLELTVPDSDQTIELTPKLLQNTLPPGDAKVTRVAASLGSTDQISARWHPRVGTKPDMELLATATSATLVSAEGGLIHTDAFFQIEVLRGQLEQLRVAVPKGQRILDVASQSRVREWSVAEEEGRQVITVSLLGRQGGKIPLEVHTERALTSEPFDVTGLEAPQAHGIHLLDVLRESGQVAVRAGSDLSLNITTQQGLARIDESEVDPRLKRPGALFFKFYSPQGRLAAVAKPVEPRLLVDQHADVLIEADQLKLGGTLHYTIERAPVYELRVGIPAGLTVVNVTCDALKQFDISEDKQLLTISLREGRIGTLGVTIQTQRSRDAGIETEDFPIPTFEPQGAEVETGKVRILAPDAIEVITDTTGIVGLQTDPAPNSAVPPNRHLVSAWTYNHRPITLPARTLTKPTRLTATVASAVEVRQGQIQVSVTLGYLVEYAGLDTFRFSVPEAVADRVQIQTADPSVPAIRQKSRAVEAVDGQVIWTVVLQRETTGVVGFKVVYDLAPTAVPTGEAADIDLLRVLEPFAADDDSASARQIPLTRITGEATVRKDRALSVAATASGGDVEPIDVRELTLLPQDGFSAFRYFKQPVKLGLTSSKYDIQNVMETVVSRGLVEVVVDRSGVAMFRCRYLTKSSERQRLKLDLPKGIEPLGTYLDRKPVALEKNPEGGAKDGWESYFVNAARTKSSDEGFLLSIQYRMTLTPPPFVSRRGDLLLRLPLLGGSGTATAPIQQFRVVLWSPNEFALVGIPNHFELESRPPLSRLMWSRQAGAARHDDWQSWIGDEGGGLFDFPTEGHRYAYTNLGGRDRVLVTWWYLPFYTWIVSGSLVLIAFVLRKTSWENKLSLLILASFLAAAYALRDPDVVLHGLAVAGYGIVAMVAIWLVHGLLQRQSRTSPPSEPPDYPAAVVVPPPGIFNSVVLGSSEGDAPAT